MSDSKLGAQARGQRNLVPEVLDKAPAGTELGWVVWVANPSSGGGGTVDQGKKGSSGESWYVQDGSGLLATAAKQDTGNASLAAIDSKLGSPLAVTGPLTNAELRAAAVPVSAASLPLPSGATTESTLLSLLGQVDVKTSTLATESTLSAAKTLLGAGLPTALVGGKLDVNLGTSSITLPVSGPLTDTQLRATAVPVSGTITVTSTTANQGTGASAAAPWSVELSDGTSFYTGAKTGQFPTTLGQTTKASSLSVAIASDQTVPVSAASLPLPTGAATEATLSLLTLAQNSTTGGQSGPLMMGAVTTNAPTYLNNRTQPFSLDTAGGMRVAGYNTPSTAQANPTNAVPTQAFLMVWNGSTWDRLLSEGITGDGDNAPSAGTVSAEVYNMGFNGATWDRIRVGGDNSTNPTVGKQYVLSARANAAAPSWTEGNAVPLSTDLAGGLRIGVTQGSTTSGQAGPLVQAAVQSAAPSLTDGQTRPLSLTQAGALRVDGSSAPQPVIGTVANGVAPANNPVLVAGYDGTLTHTLKTDTGGNQLITGTGTAGSAATGVVTVQGIASGTNLNIAQATAANLNATVVQATASSLNATVVQTTAANLNATVRRGGVSYSHIGTATTTTVKSGSGVLQRITVNYTGGMSSITAYDNTAGSGTVIASVTTPVAAPFFLDFGCTFSTGLTLVTTGVSLDYTIIYE